MEISIKKDSTDYSEILHSAQIVSGFFSRAIQDNNCIFSLPIIFHQEIVNNIKDLEDVSIPILINNNASIIEGQYTTPASLSPGIIEAVREAKKKCVSCKITLPTIDISSELNFSIGRLRANIEVYQNIFKFNKPNLCQVMYAFEDACIPDILRLLSMMLTAFIAITTLKKMNSISISGFIKGILSGILGKLLGTVRASINLSSGNISCMIEALREFSLAQLQQEIENSGGLDNFIDNLSQKISDTSEDIFRNANIDETTISDTNKEIKKAADAVKQTFDKVEQQVDRVENAIDAVGQYTSKLLTGKENEKKFENLNSIFKMISETVDQAVSDVNTYIENMFAFKTYFECESKRSGADISEIMEYINNLLTIINMLSAIAVTIAKKDLKASFCKEGKLTGLVEEKSEILKEDLKTFLENFYGKVVEIAGSNDEDLQVLIYEEPLPNSLPSLNLFSCNFEEFTQQHTLDNIVETASLQIQNLVPNNIDRDPWKYYSFKDIELNDKLIIKSITELISNTKRDDEKTSEIENNNEKPNNKEELETFKEFSSKVEKQLDNEVLSANASLKCESIDDVLKVLSLIGKREL